MVWMTSGVPVVWFQDIAYVTVRESTCPARLSPRRWLNSPIVFWCLPYQVEHLPRWCSCKKLQGLRSTHLFQNVAWKSDDVFFMAKVWKMPVWAMQTLQTSLHQNASLLTGWLHILEGVPYQSWLFTSILNGHIKKTHLLGKCFPRKPLYPSPDLSKFDAGSKSCPVIPSLPFPAISRWQMAMNTFPGVLTVSLQCIACDTTMTMLVLLIYSVRYAILHD